MLAYELVGCLGAGEGAALEFTAGFISDFKSGGKAFARREAALAQVLDAGFKQRFAVVHDGLEVFQKFFGGGFKIGRGSVFHIC